MNHPHRLLVHGGLLLLLAGGATLLAFCLRPALAAADEPPTTQRVSVGASGTQAGGPSAYPALSADGRWIAFASDASDLVAGDTNGAGDIFVKDRTSGALVCVSLSISGAPAQGESYAATISADGTRVAFASEGSDLVAGDHNELPDVFVRDLAAGTTTRISVAPSGAEADGASSAPRLSADGRCVAFTSSATNLCAGDTNGASDVFVRDLQAGTQERISAGAGSEPADGPSEGAAISSDGRYVAFASMARNLIPGENGQGLPRTWDVYRRDRLSGTTVRASAGQAGGKGNGASFAPALSADGRYVAFASQASDLVSSDLNGRTDIYRRDLASGTTVRVSVGTGGQEPAGPSLRPSISADGRLVAFESSAANLVPEFVPAGSVWSYVRDLASGTTLHVVAAAPEPAADGGTVSPVLSGDGRWIAFSSAEAGLVGGDTNAREDVFLRGPLP